MKKDKRLILWFNQIEIDDVSYVGGKNASLGEMYSNLTKEGVNIPNGFAITAHAYRYLLKKENIREKIRDILKNLDTNNLDLLAKKGEEVRRLIRHCKFPEDLKEKIRKAYSKLCKKEKIKDLDVAVRSSATAEDLPSISEKEYVFVKINNKFYFDTIKNIFSIYKNLKDPILEVPSIKDNKVDWCKASDIYKHPARKRNLYKITTSTGKQITITKDHSLIVLDKNTLKPKEVSINNLKNNEFIPSFRSIKTNQSNKKHINVLDYVSGKDIEIIDDNIYVKNKSVNWEIQNPLPKKIKIDENLLYYLGLFCAEGSTYRNTVIVTNSGHKIIKEAIKFYKKYDLYKNNKINKNSLRISCETLVRFLHHLTGKPLNKKGKGKSCAIKQVPDFVYTLSNKLIGAFLKGLFDGDGSVLDQGVSLTSKSKKLISGVSNLLSILDIEYYLNTRKPYYLLSIPLRCCEQFNKKVSFISGSKKNKLNKLVDKYNSTTLHPSMKNNLLISDVLSKKIKQVYDSKLKKNKVFIAKCPNCNNILEKTSYYKNKLRYYCKKCGKTFYEKDLDFEEVYKYINYDNKGRFVKNKTSWNKGLISGNISKRKLVNLLKKIGLKKYTKFLNTNIMWDKIESIKKIKYTGDVYDFTIPKLQNFSSGFGNIITHNSASFAGQQETYLNIRGSEDLINACKKCFASLFTNRAISYREEKGFDHFNVALSISVQRMVRSDLASSGIMFSIDTETGFEDVVLINSVYGLGENAVQGAVNPDEFLVFKPTLKKGYKSIISKRLGDKHKKMIYDQEGNSTVKNVAVDLNHRHSFSITDKQILTLAKWACTIEDHYSKKAGHYKPMDMEWALDGKTNKLFVVQARPETVQSQKNKNQIITYKLKEKSPQSIVEGVSVGQQIVSGKVNIIKDVKDIKEFKEDSILVTEMTDPDWEPIMKKAKAIITNRGGRNCHAAIISRELGVPCIVGTIDSTKILKNNQEITVDCSSGDKGYVYKGKVDYKKQIQKINKIPKTKTKIMMNVANPEQAYELSFLPNKGVGLAREEFIINSWIKIHPLALINYNKLEDHSLRWHIDDLTKGYKDKKKYFVHTLAYGIARIASAFYPKKVILRFSDFKSDEYANLVGGEYFEPQESNPMIGWRGASRYYKGKYTKGFDLECKAIKKVREEFGLHNLEVMVPFCRTIKEANQVMKRIRKNGLLDKRKKYPIKVNCMCEIPSNVLLADKFLDVFDGYSIGTNDLTQLILGLDRNSGILAHIYDERDAAVKKMVSNVIKIANKKKKYIGICGQAPSDYPEFARFLVENKIKSISLNPDTVIKTTIDISKLEKKLKRKKKRSKKKKRRSKKSKK